YAMTREQDPDLALLALGCRVLEAVPGEGVIYFAVGSLIFSWLLLRGRIVPRRAQLGQRGHLVPVAADAGVRADPGNVVHRQRRCPTRPEATGMTLLPLHVAGGAI